MKGEQAEAKELSTGHMKWEQEDTQEWRESQDSMNLAEDDLIEDPLLKKSMEDDGERSQDKGKETESQSIWTNAKLFEQPKEVLEKLTSLSTDDKDFHNQTRTTDDKDVKQPNPSLSSQKSSKSSKRSRKNRKKQQQN